MVLPPAFTGMGMGMGSGKNGVRCKELASNAAAMILCMWKAEEAPSVVSTSKAPMKQRRKVGIIQEFLKKYVHSDQVPEKRERGEEVNLNRHCFIYTDT